MGEQWTDPAPFPLGPQPAPEARSFLLVRIRTIKFVPSTPSSTIPQGCFLPTSNWQRNMDSQTTCFRRVRDRVFRRTNFFSPAPRHRVLRQPIFTNGLPPKILKLKAAHTVVLRRRMP